MMRIRLLSVFVLTIWTIISESYGSRILGISPVNSHSHVLIFEQLMKGLASRGHQVDVVSTIPQKKPFPNYTDIVIPSAIPKFVNNVSYDYAELHKQGNIAGSFKVDFASEVCEKGFAYPAMQELIQNPPNNPPYDLVITEIFNAHCFMIFGHHLKVPVIGLSPTIPHPWTHDFVANPENLAFVPNRVIGYPESMNFPMRLYNVICNIYSKLSFNFDTEPQNDIIKNHFGSASPTIRDLERNLALILTNSHMSLNGIKPTTPALVEVGGLHIQDDDSRIPMEHQKWLDVSKDGFIYFTFGSMVNIESFPKSMLRNIYESFGKIAPMRVFMKVPHVEMLPPGLPKNVRTFVWIPQLKVLKHKNIKAFITHGGLMSTQEAISCAVPMIGIPLFDDQFTNIDLYVKKKIAVRVDYHDLTTAKLDAALDEVLHNPIYRKMARQVADKFLDRPLSPMDEACYWVEYVLRHGSKALRSPALDFSWWQIALLDVYVVFLIVGVGAIFIFITSLRIIINIIYRNRSKRPIAKKFN